MTATTFLTQRQLMSKNMPADALTGPYAQQQKMLLYVLPVVFAVGGIAFPIGVLLYWTTSNLWTMGQQFYVIRNNPAPGTAGREGEARARPAQGGAQGRSRSHPGAPRHRGRRAPRSRRHRRRRSASSRAEQTREQRDGADPAARGPPAANSKDGRQQ